MYCLWFFRCSFAREKRPNIRFGHEASWKQAKCGPDLPTNNRACAFLNRPIYEVYHEKIESPVQVSSNLDIRKWRVSSTCNDGWHAYKAWFIPLELGIVVRNGCTSHNSLSKDKSFSTSRKFSFLQPHLEQPPWRWPKDVPLRMKTMR
jgi:hypothetical protein